MEKDGTACIVVEGRKSLSSSAFPLPVLYRTLVFEWHAFILDGAAV